MELKQIANLEDTLKGNINGKIVDQVLKKLTAAGENYLSLILKVDLKIKNDADNKEETVETVAKLVPPGFLKTGWLFISQAMFKNELVWYDVIVPIYQDFEEKYGAKGIFTDIYPKFYGGRLSMDSKYEKFDEHALIVLKYLEGYSNDDRHVGFDYATTKEVLKALARFHAMPVAIKHKEPKLFKEKILAHLNNAPKPPPGDDKPKPEFGAGFIDIIRELPRAAPFAARCEQPLKANPFGDPETYKIREPWATTIHNDYWVNNILLKKDEGNTKVKIVDFQGIAHKSFAADLTFLLLLSVQTSVLKLHMDEFLQFYFDEFIGYLKKFNVDTSIFKYEDYLKELEIEVKEGQFCHCIFFSNVVFRERGTGPDTVMEGSPEMLDEITKDKTERQKVKIADIVEICAERNWI